MKSIKLLQEGNYSLWVVLRLDDSVEEYVLCKACRSIESYTGREMEKNSSNIPVKTFDSLEAAFEYWRKKIQGKPIYARLEYLATRFIEGLMLLCDEREVWDYSTSIMTGTELEYFGIENPFKRKEV